MSPRALGVGLLLVACGATTPPPAVPSEPERTCFTLGGRWTLYVADDASRHIDVEVVETGASSFRISGDGFTGTGMLVDGDGYYTWTLAEDGTPGTTHITLDPAGRLHGAVRSPRADATWDYIGDRQSGPPRPRPCR